MSMDKPRRSLGLLQRAWLPATGFLAFFIVVNISAQLVSYPLAQSRWMLKFELFLAVLTLIIPYVVYVLFYTIVDRLPFLMSGISTGNADALAGQQIEPLVSKKWISLSALSVMIAGAISTEHFGIPWQGGIRLLFYPWLAVFFAGYGVAAWLYFVSMVAISRINKAEAKSSIFSWPRVETQEVYGLYFRLFVLGASLYLFAVVSIWTSPSGAWIALNTGLGMLWVFPPAAMVICYFVYFNYQIHLLLKRCLQRSDQELSSLLDDRFADWKEGLSSEQGASSITSLLEWRNTIRSEGTWPMDFKAMLVTVATLLLPTIKAIADLVG